MKRKLILSVVIGMMSMSALVGCGAKQSVNDTSSGMTVVAETAVESTKSVDKAAVKTADKAKDSTDDSKSAVKNGAKQGAGGLSNFKKIFEEKKK